MTRLIVKCLPLLSWMSLLLCAFPTVAAEDISINPWQLRPPNQPYENLNATVGDSITFFWVAEENHTVYINPTGNCDGTEGIFLGDSSPVNYIFTEDDAFNTTLGNPVFFADNIAQLCEWGMRFDVDVFYPPTASPSESPSMTPTIAPTDVPTSSPTGSPSSNPSSAPSVATDSPSSGPTDVPSATPTIAPSGSPSSSPTVTPTMSPTKSASSTPSSVPTGPPTGSPSSAPSPAPTTSPSAKPSTSPSDSPSPKPSNSPSDAPSPKPSTSPSDAPTTQPTGTPTMVPTGPPVPFPTDPPTPEPTPEPTRGPTLSPTASPTTSQPSSSPTLTPTTPPVSVPTPPPTMQPTMQPTAPPSSKPTPKPSSADAPGDQVLETIRGLRMGMAGITDLTSNDQIEWEELTASYSTSYVFNDLKGSVSNFVTSYEVTDISIPEPRRLQRMMRGGFQSSRGLEEEQQDIIIVEFTQTVKYNTIDTSKFTPELMVAAPFATDNERSAYVALLNTSTNPVLSEVKGVSEIIVPSVPEPTVPPTSPGNSEEPVLSKLEIIGIACGGAAVLILIVLFYMYCRKGGGEGSDDNSGGDPPLQVDVRNDEISTLAGPDGPPTYGDQSVATVDYDYSKAYGGAGDTSVSSAGGTFGSNANNVSLHLNAGATGVALGSMDENSYDPRYDNPGGGESNEEVIHIFAPPGKLGVVIDTPDDGAPVVHAVKDTSVIADRIIVGDKLVAVDDEDVRSMTAIKVSKMISRKGANPSRKLTIVRTVEK